MPTAEKATPPTTIIAAKPLKSDSFTEIHDPMSARDAILRKIVANLGKMQTPQIWREQLTTRGRRRLHSGPFITAWSRSTLRADSASLSRVRAKR
jgi:hypothetical protein